MPKLLEKSGPKKLKLDFLALSDNLWKLRLCASLGTDPVKMNDKKKGSATIPQANAPKID